MASRRSEFSIQYTVMGPALDLRRNRATTPPGAITLGSGVDGRFSGALRPFPGMRRLRTLTSVAGNALQNVKLFRYVAFQKAGTSTVFRGFVVYAEDAVVEQYNVELYYYDGSAWASYQLEDDVGADAEIDVAVQGKFLYYVRQGAAPKSIYWDTSALVTRTMGAGDFVTPDATSGSSVTDSGGVLGVGTYLVAYRYMNSVSKVYSGLSVPESVTVSTDGSYVTVGVSEISEAGTNIEDFDTVEIFRTISNQFSTSAFAGGVFYRVGTTTISDDGGTRSWTYNLGESDPASDAMVDEVLVQQSYYDRVLDDASAPPQAGRLATYQGIVVMGGTAGTGASDNRAQLQWSPLRRFSPETFPLDNLFRLPEVDDEVVTFVETGDFLYAVTRRVLYRFQRVGVNLDLVRMHYGRGVVGREAVAAVDESLILATPAGLLILNAATGSYTIVGALDRLFADTAHWAGSTSGLCVGKDSALGAVIVLNPDQQEAALVWDTTNGVTTLEDCDFAKMTTGLHPESPGVNRAFFVTDGGIVVYPDAYRAAAKRTMMGVTGTVNGTTTSQDGSNPKTVLNDSGASFDTTTDLTGAILHILSGDNAGESQTIESNTAHSITVDTAFSSNIALGVRYSVSPVPFRVRFWPLGVSGDQGVPRNLFDRWKVKGLAVAMTGLDLDADADNDFVTVGAYREGGSSMAVSTEVAIVANPADMYGSVICDGLQVEPGVEVMAANVDFELTAVLVNATMTISREVSASS